MIHSPTRRVTTCGCCACIDHGGDSGAQSVSTRTQNHQKLDNKSESEVNGHHKYQHHTNLSDPETDSHVGYLLHVDLFGTFSGRDMSWLQILRPSCLSNGQRDETPSGSPDMRGEFDNGDMVYYCCDVGLAAEAEERRVRLGRREEV